MLKGYWLLPEVYVGDQFADGVKALKSNFESIDREAA